MIIYGSSVSDETYLGVYYKGMLLIPSQKYSREVIRSINRAQTRVYVLALIVQQAHDADTIIHALNAAAHRGVDVRLMMDFSTYSYLNGHLKLSGIYTPQSRLATDMVNRLRSSGVHCQWLGMHHPFLFAGRTHAKWIIADNEVYSFGGINLQPDFTQEADFMLRVHDKSVAETLARLHLSIAQADKVDAAFLSQSVGCRHGTVLLDGGIPGDSIIYRRAKKLTSIASRVVVVTQYAPTGSLAKLIAQKPYAAYYNQPTSHDALTNALIWYGKKRYGITNSYTKDRYIHAKFMICTMKDGSKTAITGSHNFISYGGWLGTREVALETSDAEIIAQLESYHERYIA